MTTMDERRNKMREEVKRQQEVQAEIVRAREVSALSFVIMAQSEMVDDITITENAELFPIWDINYTTQNRLTIVQDEGKLYRNIHPILDVSQNRKPSTDTAHILWQLIGDPNDEFPMWVQPLGAHDAYEPGAKVSHNGKNWVNVHTTLNTWEPGVYGWNIVT